jgi:hypothetical protein
MFLGFRYTSVDWIPTVTRIVLGVILSAFTWMAIRRKYARL